MDHPPQRPAARLSPSLRAYLDLPRQVHVLFVGTVVNRAGAFLIPFLAIYLREQLGLSVEMATLAVGSWGAGSAVGSMLGGQLADAWGRRPVMLLSLGGAAVLMLSLSQVRSPAWVLANVVVLALVTDLFRPASAAMIADLVGPERRAHAYGLQYVAVNLGFAISPVIAGTLATHGFILLFLGDAATTLLYAGIILVGTRETRPVLPPRTATDPAAGFRDAVVDMVRNRRFVVFCLASVALGLVYVQHLAALPLFARSRGIPPDIYGRAVAVNGAMIVLCQLPVASWIAGWTRQRSLCTAALIVGVGFGLTELAHDGWTLAATVMVWTLGELMQMPFMQAIVADMAPVRFRARYLGAFSLTFAVANMLGSPAGGWALSTVGSTWVWGACALLGGVAAALFYVATHGLSPAAIPSTPQPG